MEIAAMQENMSNISRCHGLSGILAYRVCVIAILAIGVLGQLKSTAMADFVLHIDFDPVDAGVQNTLSVTQGDSFSAHLFLEFTGDTSQGLDSYSFSVDFDNMRLTFNSATSSPISGFVPHPLPPNVDIGINPNRVSSFAATYSGTPGERPTLPFSAFIGTINFTAGMTIGTTEISPVESAFDGSFNNAFNPIIPVFNSGFITITAVPEPSSILLCIVAIPLLLRRRSRTAIV